MILFEMAGINLVRLLLSLTLISSVLSLPAPQSFTFPGWTGDAGDDETGAGPPLRGPASLLGFDPEELNGANSAIVPTNSYELVPGQTDAAVIGVPLDFEDAKNPQPIRGSLGTTDPGPRNYAYDRINPNILAPPGSDQGDIPNPKWPMGLSHNRLLPDQAGWVRQQNTEQLPIATAMAGVDMRLGPNAYRELHWHKVGGQHCPRNTTLSRTRRTNGRTSSMAPFEFRR